MDNHNTIRVRQFKFSDIPHIIRLLRSSPYSMPYAFFSMGFGQVHRILVLRLMLEKYIERIKRCMMVYSVRYLFTNRYDRTVFVAEDSKNGKILGTCFISNMFDDSWDLDIIVVDPEFLHRGIGSNLLASAISYIRSKNGKELTVSVSAENFRAMRMYMKFGFKESLRIVQLELKIQDK